jgi:hypothetical protein
MDVLCRLLNLACPDVSTCRLAIRHGKIDNILKMPRCSGAVLVEVGYSVSPVKPHLCASSELLTPV